MMTRKRHREEIAHLAALAFTDHVIIEETPDRWLCRKPGTGLHSFRVVLLPGAVLVYGDIGELLVRRSGEMSWLREAVWIRDYLLKKALPRPREEFMPGDADAWIYTYLREGHIQGTKDEELRELQRRLNDEEGYLDIEEWQRDYAAAVPDGWEAIQSFYDYESGAHWCVEALAWFVSAYDRRAKEE